MTKFLALIAVAALMVSACDPAFAGRRHRNGYCRGQNFQAQSWSGQHGNGQGYYSNNSGYQNGQGYTTQGSAGLTTDGQNAPAPVTSGYPPSESSLDTNIDSSTRRNGADVNIDSSRRRSAADVNVNPSTRTNGADVNIDSSRRRSAADVNINPSTRTNGADVNINPSTRGNVAPSGAAARQNVDAEATVPQQNP